MGILCALFGHKPLTNSGYARDVGYARVMFDQIDGIGTWHLFLRAECPRCGKEYRICNVHVPRR